MATYENVEVLGAQYRFGFQDADAPVIAKFHCRTAELNWEPEAREEAQNGEGHAEAVAVSLATKRMITGSFTGYVDDDFEASDLPNGFNFKGRYYVFQRASDPRRKGVFVEVTIEAISKAGITGS